MKGTVKWFNDQKGYGFIKPEHGNDLFVHHSQVAREGRERVTLVEGESVIFEVADGPKGPMAKNVTRE